MADPGGIYRVTALNPNSRYYLSLKLNYPNDFDRLKARKDGRSDLGSDIFIHGNDLSRGCIGVGNPDIEELFALAVRTGPSNTGVIIAPHDLREKPPPRYTKTAAPWLPELYARLRKGLPGLMRAPVAFVEVHRARGVWSEALTTTLGPGGDGLLVQRKVGSGGSRRRLSEDPVVSLAIASTSRPAVTGMRCTRRLPRRGR